MKSRFDLTCILGSAFFIFHLVLCAPISAELAVTSIDSMEIEKRAIAIAEKINETANAILSIAPGEYTYENTLKSWSRLSTQLSQELGALNNLDISDSASQVSDQLHAYLMEVIQNHELHQILMNCSFNVARDVELDPFQRYIGTRFIENDSDEPIYLSGIAEEQNSPETAYTVLSLKSGFLLETQVSNLARKILSENAGVVCIQDIASDDHAYNLYEILKKNYARFVYLPPSSVLSHPRNHRKNGMLIACKFGEDEFGILLAGSRRDRDDDNGGASFGAGGKAKWGDGNGIQWEVYLNGEAHDDRGNYVEAEIIQRDNGSGEVDIHGGHESDHESRNK